MIIVPGQPTTDVVVGGDSNTISQFSTGEPEYLEVAVVYPTPQYVKGDKGDPGDPGAVTDEFIDRVADEVAIDLSAELEPAVDLLLLFDNALI
jgi:hypothetical protein